MRNLVMWPNYGNYDSVWLGSSDMWIDISSCELLLHVSSLITFVIIAPWFAFTFNCYQCSRFISSLRSYSHLFQNISYISLDEESLFFVWRVGSVTSQNLVKWPTQNLGIYIFEDWTVTNVETYIISNYT